MNVNSPVTAHTHEHTTCVHLFTIMSALATNSNVFNNRVRILFRNAHHVGTLNENVIRIIFYTLS